MYYRGKNITETKLEISVEKKTSEKNMRIPK